MLTRYGPWALVTGASSGIGLAFAKRLAFEGFSIVFVARRGDVLRSIADELEQSCRIQTKVVELDLSLPNAVETLSTVCRDMEIGLFICNAGTGLPGSFLKNDPIQENAILQLNVITPMNLIRELGQQMASRGRGGIVLVASTMAFLGVPYMANYAATKSYMLILGEALYHEFKQVGVDVLVVAPGPTDTSGKDLFPIAYDRIPIDWMDPDQVVRSTFRAMGKTNLIIPGIRNQVFTCVSSGLWFRRCVSTVLRNFARRVIPSSRL